MDPVKTAIWCIESSFTAELTLDEIAQVSGVSRFHLSRAFGVATGRSVMRYVRERRLSEAARQLADGAPDILTVALDWGYGSHEAFTRAFREQFGVTPEELRARRDLSSLALVEPLPMHDITPAPIAEPRIVTGKPLLIAGFSGHFSMDKTQGIPLLWQKIAPHFGHIPGQSGYVAYGASYNCDENGAFDYIAGTEVSFFGDLTDEFARLIQQGDVTALTRIPGIGKKTAERMLVELRDRVNDLGPAATASGGVPKDPVAEATVALQALGYKPAEVSRLVRDAAASGDRAEDIIRKALKAALR